MKESARSLRGHVLLCRHCRDAIKPVMAQMFDACDQARANGGVVTVNSTTQVCLLYEGCNAVLAPPPTSPHPPA